MSDLIELAKRVEAATGPDRELDALIRKAAVGDFGFCGDEGWQCAACSVPAHELTQQPGCGAPLGLSDERRSYPNDWREDERLPAYASSLDAAMTLAEGCEAPASALLRNAMDDMHGLPVLISQIRPAEYAQTLARFFTAACLRARAAQETKGHTLPVTDPTDFEYPGRNEDQGPVLGSGEES